MKSFVHLAFFKLLVGLGLGFKFGLRLMLGLGLGLVLGQDSNILIFKAVSA